MPLVFAVAGLIAFERNAHALVYSECAPSAPKMCHVDLTNAYETEKGIKRSYSVGYHVDPYEGLLYIKVAKQTDPRPFCPGTSATAVRYSVKSKGTPPNSAPAECKAALIAGGFLKDPAKKTPPKSKTTANNQNNAGGGALTNNTGVGVNQTANDDAGNHAQNNVTGNVAANETTNPALNVAGANEAYNKTLSNLEERNGKYSLANRATLDGQSVTLKQGPDGGIIGVWNSGPNAGQWFDPHTKTVLHSDVEYTANGKTYHSLAEAKAAGLDKLDGSKVTVKKYDDSGKEISSTTVAEAEKDAKKKSLSQKETNKKSYDDCQKSMEYAKRNNIAGWENFKCNGTRTIAQAAEVSNQVLTTAGRNIVNTMGAQSAMNAQNGSPSAGYDGAAKMARTTKTYETGLAAANAVAAAVLAKKANQHKRNLAELHNREVTDEASEGLDDATGGLRSTTKDAAQLKLAIEQQSGARNLAATAAMKSTFVALQSAVNAKNAANMEKASKQNAKLAREAAALQSQMIMNYDPNQLAPPPGQQGYDPNAMAATGDGTQTTSEQTSIDENLDPNAGGGGAMLGDGKDLGGGTDGVTGPVAGQFKAGSNGGGGGGGGGGAPAAGGGGAAGGGPAAEEDAKAAYASEFGTKERYESGGGNPAAGRGKGGAGGKDDGAGIDLNGLLAQFLPKSEEDLGSKNGILDSFAFGGARAPAQEEPASFLDKNADLFQRIHETMNEKNRRGQLGI